MGEEKGRPLVASEASIQRVGTKGEPQCMTGLEIRQKLFDLQAFEVPSSLQQFISLFWGEGSCGKDSFFF